MIYEVLQRNLTNKGKLPCSICSKMKKAAICQAANELNCNKVAFGHHADDAIETFMMNAIYGGRLATFLPKMELTRERITFIRPLIYCREQIIKKTINSSKIPVSESTCPNDKNTEREVIKTMLKDIYKSHPEAKQNFLNMLSNESKMELWHIENNEDE
jgi:tRNA(Ile)-lysidine synthase TilS/MesJ